jgi:hypothetical protein
VLLDNQAKAGVKPLTTLEWQGEKAVLTFPVPDVPGATAVATLTNYLPDSVVVTNGADKTEFIYGKWADWNNPLFKIDALYAGTILERKNGMVMRNVTAKVTEIGQIYVVMPVRRACRRLESEECDEGGDIHFPWSAGGIGFSAGPRRIRAGARRGRSAGGSDDSADAQAVEREA